MKALLRFENNLWYLIGSKYCLAWLYLFYHTYLVYIFILNNRYEFFWILIYTRLVWWINIELSNYVKCQTKISSWSKYCLLCLMFLILHIYIPSGDVLHICSTYYRWIRWNRIFTIFMVLNLPFYYVMKLQIQVHATINMGFSNLICICIKWFMWLDRNATHFIRIDTD